MILQLTSVLLASILLPAPQPQAQRRSTNRSSTTQGNTAQRNVAHTDTSIIEVKDDRFSGKRTVRMLPVRVAPKVEMMLTGEVNVARKPDFMEQDLGVMVTAEFTTPYKGGAEFSREMDFGFLIDGKRTVLRTPPASTVLNPYANHDTDNRKAIAVLTQSTLERVAAGRKIEMKLGATEVTLDEATLKSIRAFVAALKR
jgi:hypothetical protein